MHYLVPGSGVSKDGAWHPSRANFWLPVKALSKVMRAKFREVLRQADAAVFAQVPLDVWQQEWVVHCQPVGTGENAVKYLAPYIFRVACDVHIASNRRIVKMDDGKMTFQYQQTETGKLKTCTLPAEAFIHRFLQHVLPKGFVKVRYYGFLAVGQRKRLATLREQLSCSAKETSATTEDSDEEPLRSRRTEEVRCPSCGQVMRCGAVIHPTAHSPPGMK